jgi:hypothetical protein
VKGFFFFWPLCFLPSWFVSVLQIGEKDSIEFRFEAFNALNAHHFSDPNQTLGSSTFGQITATSFPARELQLGLKYRF